MGPGMCTRVCTRARNVADGGNDVQLAELAGMGAVRCIASGLSAVSVLNVTLIDVALRGLLHFAEVGPLVGCVVLVCSIWVFGCLCGGRGHSWFLLQSLHCFVGPLVSVLCAQCRQRSNDFPDVFTMMIDAGAVSTLETLAAHDDAEVRSKSVRVMA